MAAYRVVKQPVRIEMTNAQLAELAGSGNDRLDGILGKTEHCRGAAAMWSTSSKKLLTCSAAAGIKETVALVVETHKGFLRLRGLRRDCSARMHCEGGDRRSGKNQEQERGLYPSATFRSGE